MSPTRLQASDTAVGAPASACIAVLNAPTVRGVAQALVQGAPAVGLTVQGLAWWNGEDIVFEPAQLRMPKLQRAAQAALAGDKAPGGAYAFHELPLQNALALNRRVLVVLSAGQMVDEATDAALLLDSAARRLDDLFRIEHLQSSVSSLEQAEHLQRALFAIADMASSDYDMQRLLKGLHQIVGKLMYAENLIIALYDWDRETLRFIYYADETDGTLFDPDEEIPASKIKGSVTLGLIRHGQPVKGPSNDVLAMLGLSFDKKMGTPSIDFMGVPMRRGGRAVGAMAVQSYVEGKSYTEFDQTVLSFVAEHVLTAVERKMGQEALERRVVERTQDLATANAQLQEQIAERERAAHLQATLFRIAALTHNQNSDEEFFRSIHQAVGELINAENFYIALLSDDGTQLHFPYGVTTSNDKFVTRPLGLGMSEYAIRQGKTVLAGPALFEQLIAAGELRVATAGAWSLDWLGAPLLGPQGVMGLVAVQSFRPDLTYSQEDADLLTFVSYQIASSLQRRQQAEALRTMNAQLEQRVEERTRELRKQIEVREQIEEQLKHQVMHDALTGLPNRVYLRDRMERAINVKQRNPERRFALLYLDVDRFKLFNDSFGHLVGDAVLREVSSRLIECVRVPDVVARLSGDEFAILLEDCGKTSSACRVAQRIQTRMQEPLITNDRTLHVGVSIGIAMGQSRYQGVDEILHDADTALYRAKAGGRQRIELFDDSLQTSAMNVLDLEHEMRRALHENEFVPYFQPIVRLDSGATVGYEALIRWKHPTRGLLAPGAFLPVAEETGLIEAIDWHMYRQACKTGVDLLVDGQFLNINISPRHFQNKAFEQKLLALVAETGMDPARLCIEVTESTLLHDPDAVEKTLHRLHGAKIRTALDDFGTGYSSLSHVHRFPPKTLKIDRSFTQTLGDAEQERGSAIIGSVLNLAQALHIDVVAEGVETPAQQQVLLAMGCMYAQGYLFGRPEAASHWMNRR